MPQEIYIIKRITENLCWSSKPTLALDFLLMRQLENGIIIEHLEFKHQFQLEEMLLKFYKGKQLINGHHPLHGQRKFDEKEISTEMYRPITPENPERFEQAGITFSNPYPAETDCFHPFRQYL